MEAEGRGILLQTFDFFLFEFGFGLLPNRGIVRAAIFNEMPDDSGQLMGHGGDGFGGSQASFPAAETIAQIILAVPETLGGEA